MKIKAFLATALFVAVLGGHAMAATTPNIDLLLSQPITTHTNATRIGVGIEVAKISKVSFDVIGVTSLGKNHSIRPGIAASIPFIGPTRIGISEVLGKRSTTNTQVTLGVRL